MRKGWATALLVFLAVSAWATEPDRFVSAIPDPSDVLEEVRDLRPNLPQPPVRTPPPAKEPDEAPPAAPKAPEKPEKYDDAFAYYGRVQAVRPKVVVGNRTLIGQQELLDFLAPGMQVEVEGRVRGRALEVRSVRVIEPKYWAYFEGPDPTHGWSRVWYLNGKVWKVQAADPGPRTRLLACYAGGWHGLPPELTPELAPPEPGLWLFEGLAWEGEVQWTRLERLGGCEADGS